MSAFSKLKTWWQRNIPSLHGEIYTTKKILRDLGAAQRKTEEALSNINTAIIFLDGKPQHKKTVEDFHKLHDLLSKRWTALHTAIQSHTQVLHVMEALSISDQVEELLNSTPPVVL